ncbi:MAG: TRAP transporter substrate-binding protein [Oceanibaculum sp.]
MERRSFIKAGLAGSVGATAALAAPSIARAQTSFNWKMTNAYGPNAPFYVVGPGSPTDFIKKIDTMSGGRLKIQHFAAGELIPALEGFDAVAAGTVEMNAANSYFWSGKTFAAQYFTTVPFGLSFMGHMAWLYHGGGLELWQEAYKAFNMVAFPINNTGVQMTGWFRKEITGVDDLKGLRMRIPGLAGKVYSQLGVDARLLPGGEIFPALERGVIDAAEFVGPYQDRRLGLQKAAKFYYTTGWHEPATTGELAISLPAWEKLPADIKEMVKVASMACVMDSVAWSEAVNGDALTELVEKEGVIARQLPAPVIARLKEVTFDTLATEAAKDPMTKKVHDSFMAFKAKHDKWSSISEGPWQSTILGS